MKKRQRRTFTPEFKLEAACLVVDKGYSYTEACRSLDVGESARSRWVEQLKTERDGIAPSATALTPEQKKIQELEAKVKRLEDEKRILKKATALLMSDEYKNMR